MARKPLAGTVAGNVLAHGTGALNIDGCRVAMSDDDPRRAWQRDYGGRDYGAANNDIYQPMESRTSSGSPLGRWPANVVLDEDAAAQLDRQSGHSTSPPVGSVARTKGGNTIGTFAHEGRPPSPNGHGDSGGASRFYYTAKAAPDERPRVNGLAHPTVKPLDLMRWLVRLVTPPGGLVLDPFAGSGTTGEACIIEGFRCVLIEREADYLPLIEARLSKPIQPTLGGTA